MAIELSAPQLGSAAESAWNILRAAAALAPDLERANAVASFALGPDDGLSPVANGAAAALTWRPASGWHAAFDDRDPRAGLVALYLPICSATPARPITIGHLGQSLDGFIATHSGDSQFITGDDDMVHMHRLRALCDAVVVGAGTVAADDPQLTTRRVPGPNPLRVIVDPERRVSPTAGVFVDKAAPTLYICCRSRIGPGETTIGAATIVGIDEGRAGGTAAAQALALLHARGLARVFVEGGGVTVSAFLEADLLDRLQIAVAPVLIGDGRPAIRLSPPSRLRDCRRPSYRVFRMGGDMLFDCDLRAQETDSPSPTAGTVVRII